MKFFCGSNQLLATVTCLLTTTTLTAARSHQHQLPNWANPLKNGTQHKPVWTLIPTNSTQQFRGLSGTKSIVWLSGTNGTVLQNLHDAKTWTDVSPKFAPSENPSDYQFRDIQAWGHQVAVVLSIGAGNASRIYRTRDSGKNWSLTFVNQDENAFYDCLSFDPVNLSHGIAMSDPVAGKFRVIETWNGGKTWDVMDPEKMPPALEGEAGFAASGTCVDMMAGRWYIATGGVDPGRIFRSSNLKQGWKVSNSSIAGGAAAGVFSVQFRDARNGIAVGGDFEKPTANINIASWTQDGGASWHKADTFPAGYRSGVAWVPGSLDAAIAVGTSGSDYSIDGGRNWVNFDNGSFDAVQCFDGGVCWASGARGRVARLDFNRL